MDRPKSFSAYYGLLFREFGRELWGTWRTEAWPSVLIAAAIYAITRHEDLNAWKTFLFTAEAACLYLGGWGIYHLVRAPWKLSREIAPIVQIDEAAALKEKCLSLSKSILEFAYECRPHHELPDPQPETYDVSVWQAKAERDKIRQAQAEIYDQELLEMYEYRFKRDVTTAIAALKERNLTDPELEEYSRDLMGDVNYGPLRIIFPKHEYLRQIGRRIGELADGIETKSLTKLN